MEEVDEAVDREMTSSHWRVHMKENLGNGAAKIPKILYRKPARNMIKYYITLDYSSFVHAARDNEGYGSGTTLLEMRWKKTEFRHLHLKEQLMCLKDKKMDLRTGHCFSKILTSEFILPMI